MKTLSATEVRLGNWVNDGEQNVRLLGHIHIMRAQLAFYQGIPLTPEILLKAGANQDQYGSEWAYVLKISAISIKFRFNGIDCYSELGGIYLGGNIEYLHQLQNLYHSLTHHELTIEL